jgi:titin
MTVTGLALGAAYTFQVAAKNDAGRSSFSEKSSPAVKPRAVPGVPTITSGVEGNTQVTLTWTAPANNGDAITDYEVQSCTNNSTICSPVVQNASAGKITICHANSSGGYVTLTVDRNSLNGHGDHSSDIIPVSSTGCPSSTKVATTTTSTTLPPAPDVVVITVIGLTNGVPYTFKVTAKNAAGFGNPGTSPAYTPRRAPDAPTGVTATAEKTGGIDVRWTTPNFNGGSPITGYVVEYATENDDYVPIVGGAVTGTLVNVAGLTKGVEYTFRVAAKNIAGQGAYSAESPDAIATARTVPGAPTATASSTRDGDIELEWKFVAPVTDGGSEITQYDVEWAKVGTSSWSGAAYDLRTTRIEGLEIGKSYKFRTTATNVAGPGGYSAEVVAIPQVPPKSVTNLTYLLIKEAEVQTLALNWKAPVDTGGAPLTKYFLAFCDAREVCKTKATIVPRNNMLSTTTSFVVAPGTYRYYVAAVNDAGVEECADPKQIKCGAWVRVEVAENADSD